MAGEKIYTAQEGVSEMLHNRFIEVEENLKKVADGDAEELAHKAQDEITRLLHEGFTVDQLLGHLRDTQDSAVFDTDVLGTPFTWRELFQSAVADALAKQSASVENAQSYNGLPDGRSVKSGWGK